MPGVHCLGALSDPTTAVALLHLRKKRALIQSPLFPGMSETLETTQQITDRSKGWTA